MFLVVLDVCYSEETSFFFVHEIIIFLNLVKNFFFNSYK